MKSKRFFAVVVVIGLLHSMIGQLSVNAQSTTGVYSVTVNTPGTFGQVMLQTVENWSDVMELTIKGRLNDSDMAYFSRMGNLTKLDLGEADISYVTGCTGLESLQTVVLPESVITIADRAFYSCTSLSTVNLDQITEIGSLSFSECISLTGNLPLANLKTLGASAFRGCLNLTTVEMPVVTKIGSYAFYMGNKSSMLTTVIMPNVKSIGEGAFQSCSKLQSVNIPNCTYLGGDITNADNYYQDGCCFEGCSSLISVTLSDELDYIPFGTFSSTGLETIKLPSSLKVIGCQAFYESKLSAIDIPEGVKKIYSESFRCPLEKITLPSTVESIGSDAFYYSKWSYNSSTNSYILKDVYCKSVVPIVTSAFNNDMAKGATLHVPAFSVSAYKLDDEWYKFNKIMAIDGELSDITINNTFTIIEYTGLANNANLNLTYSEDQNTSAHLTISANSSLSLDKFYQYQNLKYGRESYYDEDGNYRYRYTYPYCTTMITNNEVHANNVSTKILLPTNRWSFISMPYDVNVSSIVVPDSTMWVVRKYNGANRATMTGETWENVTSGQILNAGEGYIFHCVKDNSDSWSTDYIEFEFPAINNSNKNNLFSYSDVIKTINEYSSEFSHNRGWNLIGNPYPSYLSSQYVEFPAPITVWNGDGYTAYSLADDEYVLRPNEAFFVQCPVNTNQIKFLKDGRTHSFSSASAPYRSRAMTQTSDYRSILNFIISNEDYSDRVRLVLNEKAASDYEIERDASKFMSSNASVPQIYIIDNGINYAIDERPLGTGEYTLGVRISKEGKYRLSLNSKNSNHEVLLIDHETNETIDLNKTSYSFESVPQTVNNRFTIKIKAKGIQTSVEDIETSTVGFHVNGNRLYIDQDVKISLYSIDGRLVYSDIVDGYVELSSGIYILSINGTPHKIAIK